MKKKVRLPVVLLMLLGLMLSVGCTKTPGAEGGAAGDTGEPDPARMLAIDKTEGYGEYTLTEDGEEEIDLIHIDRKTYPERAEEYHALAQGCLEQHGIEAEIEDLYLASLGLAAHEYSLDPVMIITSEESSASDPLFLVVLNVSDRLIDAGSFFSSEAGGMYRDKCFEAYRGYKDRFAKSIGLYEDDGARRDVLFNINRLEGLEIQAVPEVIEECLLEAQARLVTYCTVAWRLEGQEGTDENGYYTVQHDHIRSLADVESWLGEYFSDDLVGYIVENHSGPYKEEDGVLKALDVGMGMPIDLEDCYPIKIAKISDDHYYLIIEAKRIEIDWESETIDWENAPRYFEEYLLELRQSNKGWIFYDYTDVAFGFI